MRQLTWNQIYFGIFNVLAQFHCGMDKGVLVFVNVLAGVCHRRCVVFELIAWQSKGGHAVGVAIIDAATHGNQDALGWESDDAVLQLAKQIWIRCLHLIERST